MGFSRDLCVVEERGEKIRLCECCKMSGDIKDEIIEIFWVVSSILYDIKDELKGLGYSVGIFHKISPLCVENC